MPKSVSAGLGCGLGWTRPCLWRQRRWGGICGLQRRVSEPYLYLFLPWSWCGGWVVETRPGEFLLQVQSWVLALLYMFEWRLIRSMHVLLLGFLIRDSSCHLLSMPVQQFLIYRPSQRKEQYWDLSAIQTLSLILHSPFWSQVCLSLSNGRFHF